jgi:hypothetical protein
MGLVSTDVKFEGKAPPLSRIVEKIKEIGGLPLVVEESNSEIRGDLYDLHERIGFACLANHDIKIYSYRDGAVKKFLEQSGMSKMPVANVVEGAREPTGTQTVYLEGYMGQDLSIMDVTILALESLGGHPRIAPTREVREKYAKPLAEQQLNQRKRSLRLRGIASAIVAVLALPFVLAYVAFVALFAVVQTSRFGKKFR